MKWYEYPFVLTYEEDVEGFGLEGDIEEFDFFDELVARIMELPTESDWSAEEKVPSVWNMQDGVMTDDIRDCADAVHARIEEIKQQAVPQLLCG